MAVLKYDDNEIYYEEFGEGYPILLFAAGGMHSKAELWHPGADGPPRVWNDWTEVLAANYRVIAMDQRNAGASTAPVAADDGWHSYTADHLALMDHLGHERYHVLGHCIGVSFCFKIYETAPERISAMVLQNPIGLNPEAPDLFPTMFKNWAEPLCAARPDQDVSAVDSFGENLFGGEFVYSVSRDFVKNCDAPILVMPGDDAPHPAVIGNEVIDLLPACEKLINWKGPDHIDAQREAVVGFLAKRTPS